MAKEIYIAGEWRLGRGAVIQSLFPADQSVNAELSTATLEDVNEAIEKDGSGVASTKLEKQFAA